MESTKTRSPVVYFFRGLNSAGDEILRLGPLAMGPYSARFLPALKGVTAVNVHGMGRGSIGEMGENALKFLQQDILFQSLNRPVHFLGHSMGGLVARYLAHKPEVEARVASIVTLGTPHLGLPAALPRDQSRAMRAIRHLVNRSQESAESYYEDCRPENMQVFNQNFPDRPEILYASVLGVVKRHKLPWIFRVIDSEYNQESSDGLVPERSQNWGQLLGRFQLDHLEQVGLCQDFHPIKRLHFNLEFSRLCRTLIRYWSSFPH